MNSVNQDYVGTSTDGLQGQAEREPKDYSLKFCFKGLNFSQFCHSIQDPKFRSPLNKPLFAHVGSTAQALMMMPG